jgi:hypothetical protein
MSNKLCNKVGKYPVRTAKQQEENQTKGLCHGPKSTVFPLSILVTGTMDRGWIDGGNIDELIDKLI